MKEALSQIPGVRRTVRFLRRAVKKRPAPPHERLSSKGAAREHVLDTMPRQSVCAEIGVHEGQFSGRIIRRLEPERLHLIDPWKHEESEKYHDSWYGGLGPDGQSVMDWRYESIKKQFDSQISTGQVVIHRDYSSNVAGSFDDEYFDWIYIDGNHQYDFVKQDLDRYYPKVKVGGFLAGDDYGSEGWWQNGVQKAVDEFVAQSVDRRLEVRETQFIIQKR